MKTAKNILKMMLLLSLTAFSENHEVTPDNEFIPNDPLFSQQWGLKNIISGFDIAATKAWAIERGSKKIAIVILGTGADYTHPDLKNNMWINPGEIPNNGIDDDGNGYIDDIHGVNVITGSGDPMDDQGHETMVAGVIGAEGNNGIGIAGVMHNVSLIACKFLSATGAGSTEDAIKCLDYVADLAKRDIGATIVATNNSWGGGPFSQSLLDAIKEHRDLGILFITTAGNGNSNLDDYPAYPASYDSANIIVVAKADPLGAITRSSSYGRNSVHLAAPGQDILTIRPNNRYKVFSGSCATGFISGIAGLLKSHDSNLTWEEIKHKIMTSTTRLATEEDQNKVMSGGFANAFIVLTN